MKKQVLMAGRKRQKAIENSYYEEALMNIAYGAQLMCLIKMLGHTKEEIEAACKKVTKEQVIDMIVTPLEPSNKKQTKELMHSCLDFTHMNLDSDILNQLCIDGQENSKENDVE